MFKKILLGLVVIVAAVLLFALTKPDTFSVERSATIKAPPDKIYPLISDFHQWPQWSPWEKLDPNMKRSHSGAPQGVGAVYAWTGNDAVGEGRMEITGAKPPGRSTSSSISSSPSPRRTPPSSRSHRKATARR